MALYLASGSPRRVELLQQIGVPFQRLAAPEIDETPQSGEPALAYVRRMAAEKAQALPLPDSAAWILAADTTVVQGETILGKPESDAHALAMLSALNGQRHQVITALCLRSANHETVCEAVTEVRFRHLSEVQLRAYVATGEGRDKAGGYAIQGQGAALVADIQGSYSGVVGLPLEILVTLLDQHHLPYWQACP